ncbi:hypothetical protein [Larkinella terrae]|uniref:Uncharacterized protein n=1 Tax=Larkinella terrae TaxID=2025311 RepID=A0A7K0EKY4_9BACT|nr:hypothetical protein [Larkinella terrae]MRS62118.1 hypothetical protein [Larkinella terrae]
MDQNDDTKRIDQALVEQVLRGDTKVSLVIGEETGGGYAGNLLQQQDVALQSAVDWARMQKTRQVK